MTHDAGERAAPPRVESGRLVRGAGRYVDDQPRHGLAHVSFVRSDLAHASILSINCSDAKRMPGVLAVLTAADLRCVLHKLPKTTLRNLPAHVSPEQAPLADQHVRYQGEPVVMVIASSKLLADDAAATVQIEYQQLSAYISTASDLSSSEDHAAQTAFQGEAGQAPATPCASTDFEASFQFARQTGVPLEPRGLIAEFDPFERELDVLISHQSPHLVQAVLADLFGLAHNRIRIRTGDVGGGFGVKLHIYPDELAVVAAAIKLERPVKYIATRTESFVSDCHAREFSVYATLTMDVHGAMAAMRGQFRNAIGAYSIYPRASIGDAALCLRLLGAPYAIPAIATSAQSIWQNKVPAGAIRGVSQPIPCTVAEHLIDVAARAQGEDPAAFRRRHFVQAQAGATTSPLGLAIDQLSLVDCLDKLLLEMAYDALRAEQRGREKSSLVRGIGVTSFVELTAPGAGFYAPSGIPITPSDECRVRLEADGSIFIETGATDQGQGTVSTVQQIVADTLSVNQADVRISAGDSAGAVGGGAWASRGLVVAGEAAALAADELRSNILEIGAALLQRNARDLSIRDGAVIAQDGATISVAELAHAVWYNPNELPLGCTEKIAVSRRFALHERAHIVANGVQASLVEVDIETGSVRVLKHWVVEDCGRVINHAFVDGQIVGAVAQGIGAALMENCHYDASGQCLSGSLLDYAIPRGDDTPVIEVHHIETPVSGTRLGVKGVGEAGTIGAPAAVWCAVNDALSSIGAVVTTQPMTPEIIAMAVKKAQSTHSEQVI